MMDEIDRIPIRNIYYLLLYAWNRLEEAEIVDVSIESATNLLNLFARVLTGGTQHLLKRGMDRGYMPLQEELHGIRGKVNFSLTLKRQLMANAILACEFDDLSYNVFHNRILKTILASLSTSPDVDQSLRSDLADLCRRLGTIEDVSLCAAIFRRVSLHRNNTLYGFLMDVCEMIYRYYLASEAAGKEKFRNLIRDEEKMPQVFEDFIRNFYRIELEGRFSGFQVKGSEIIHWDVEAPKSEDEKYLPAMVTDISIKTPGGYMIIDTKYYKNTLQAHYNKKIHSANLYQLFSYLKNAEAKGPGYRKCKGVLLYPTVQQNLDLNYEIKGHRISIKTLDLARQWQSIHTDLLNVVGVKTWEGDTVLK